MTETATFTKPKPALGPALKKGLMRRCPACGQSSAFEGYLTVKTNCEGCDTPLAHYKSDDLPPYLTILIVGHIVVSLMMQFVDFSNTASVSPFAIFFWPALTAGLVLVVLPFVKGMVLGLHWHLHQKGALHQDSIRR